MMASWFCVVPHAIFGWDTMLAIVFCWYNFPYFLSGNPIMIWTDIWSFLTTYLSQVNKCSSKKEVIYLLSVNHIHTYACFACLHSSFKIPIQSKQTGVVSETNIWLTTYPPVLIYAVFEWPKTWKSFAIFYAGFIKKFLKLKTEKAVLSSKVFHFDLRFLMCICRV